MDKKLDVMDREHMIFQIMANTRYTEDALQKLSDDKIIELYKLKVETTMR
ncbi:MAG TPA: hypothetical protein VK144_10285 [Bacillota bacterium]|nr:hypothetical protein [Bacillota bacterium]